MRNGHLIADGTKAIVGGLFHFSVAQARVILLNDLSVFEDLFECFAIPGHPCTSVVSDIEVLRAAITFAGME